MQAMLSQSISNGDMQNLPLDKEWCSYSFSLMLAQYSVAQRLHKLLPAPFVTFTCFCTNRETCKAKMPPY